MIDKDPTSFSWLTYAWMIGLASWGGLVRYYHRITVGNECFRWVNFAGEILASGFFGVITFFLATAAEFEQLVTAAMVGISGHMGAHIKYYLFSFVQKKYGIKIQFTDESKK